MSSVPTDVFNVLRSKINFWAEPTLALVAWDQWEYDHQLAIAREFNAIQQLKLQLINTIEVKFREVVECHNRQMAEANGKIVVLTSQLQELNKGYTEEKMAHEQEIAKVELLAREIEKLKQILSD